MKKAATLLLFLLSISLWAQERVPVWPKGKMPDPQGHQIAAMTDEAGREGFNPVSIPTNTGFRIWNGSRNPPIRTGPA